MSMGKFPFEDTPENKADFTKAVEDKIEDPSEVVKSLSEEEKLYKILEKHLEFKPPYNIEEESIPARAYGTRDIRTNKLLSFPKTEKEIRSEETRHESENNKFTDNPIKSNVGLKSEWIKATSIGFDPEEGAEE